MAAASQPWPKSRFVVLGLLIASALWAGRHFPAKPGETTVPDQLLVKFRRGTPAAQVAAALPAGAQILQVIPQLNLHHIQLPPSTPAARVDQLANHPLVEYVEPNRVRHVTLRQPNDPGFGDQWELSTTQALKGWGVMPARYLDSSVAGTARIRVAVLDTGADCTHPDFKNSGAASTDSAAGGQISWTLSRAYERTTIHPAACPWLDDHGHGTHTAGTLAAATHNAEGVSALGYPLELIIYKVMKADGSGDDNTIAQAIADAADAGANIVSLSLGGTGYSQAMQDAVNYAWERNTLVVAAAGNDNTNALFFPAGASHAIGVAATDTNNNRSSYSNYGNFVAIAAPGDDILSTLPTYPGTTLGTILFALNYGTLSGTSMATPQVSALGGLLAMTTPNYSAAAVAQRIQQGANSSIAMGGWSQDSGYGVINAWQSISGTLRPASAGGLVGQVVDGAGVPITGAVVTAGGQSVTTADTGLFRISNLTAGNYTLTATASGFPAQSLTATVAGGADNTVTVAMGVALGTITGTVTGGGLPLAGVVVQALSSSLIKATAITNTSGQYSLSVAAGVYDVRASALSHIATAVAAQTVAAGSTITVSLSLPKMGSISGTIRDPNGNPVPNADVLVMSSNFSAGATTDASGNFSTIGLPAGSYTVTVSTVGYAEATLTGITAGPDAVTPISVPLSYLPTGFPTTRVNAGGPAFTEPSGRAWSADASFVGGSAFSTSKAISGTSTPTLYQTERYGSFRYEIPAANGGYTVNLKFAELYYAKAGQRVFHVKINGQTVLSNFDVINEAGAALTAVDRRFPVNVTTGQIVIEFVPVVSDPKVNAIEIVPVTLTPSSAGLTDGQTQQFTATVSGAANTAVNWSLDPAVGTLSASGLYTAPATVTTVQTILVTAASVVNPDAAASAVVTLVPNQPIRVNAGGSAYTDSAGRTWSADTGFQGGTAFSTTTTVTGTDAQALYQTERYGSPNLRYRFNVPNGNFRVTLKFAEIYFAQAGQRVFDAAINGQTVLSAFDIVAQAGGSFRAIDRQFSVTATTGLITLDFTARVSNAKVSAIEIVPDSGVRIALSPASAALTSSQTQQFTATVTGSSNTAVTWTLSPAVGSISSAGLYTPPASIATSQTITVTATSVADPTTFASATVLLLLSGPIRVNSGGPAYTDPSGNVWSADTGYTGGSTYTTSSPISGTTTPVLYQTERYGSPALQYRFGLAAGSYKVTLKFAENYFTQAGQRVFNVAINGQTVLSNFDIFAAAGAAKTAVDRQFVISAANNQVQIDFTSVVSNPKIDAIEIVPNSGVGIAVSPASVTLSNSQTQQFTATVTGAANTAVMWSLGPAVGTISSSGLYTAPTSLTASPTVTVMATSVADPNATASATVTLLPSGPVRVNAGGPAYTDPSGNVWSADTGYTGGSTYTTSSAISGTTTPVLYQTERYGSPTLQYRFGLVPGAYKVTLKFAENYFTQAGQRVFNVAINGQRVLSNFDIFAAAGAAKTAVDRQVVISAPNNQVQIDFTSVTSNPKIDAIEILPYSGPVVTVSPGSATLTDAQTQQFTATVTGTANTAVTWSVSPAAGTVSPSGLYTAPPTVASAQTVSVTATSVADPTSSASAFVTLMPKTPTRVNAGGSAYTDPGGLAWSADKGFTGGTAYSTAAAISGTNAAPLYQTERYGSSFQYRFSVPNGTAGVTLKFAEIYFTKTGQRVFNVTINGQTVLSNFDIVAQAGAAFKALDRQFSVNVTNGEIVIVFTGVVDKAKISAIEIVPN